MREHIFYLNKFANFTLCLTVSVISYWVMLVLYQLFVHGNTDIYWREAATGLIIATAFSLLMLLKKNDFVSLDSEILKVYQFPYKKEIRIENILHITERKILFIKFLKISEKKGVFYIPLIFSDSMHFQTSLSDTWKKMKLS